MALLVLLFPALGAALAGLGGKFIGGAGAARVTVLGVALSFILSLTLFIEVGLGHTPVVLRLAPWRSTETRRVHWGRLLDSLSVTRLIVVTGISTAVHLYATEYRGEDPHLPRFRATLSLFTLFRLILVTADSFVQRFVGWEGVGLCSYLLINFWFARVQANKAALKARLLNRVGDRGVVLARGGLYAVAGTLDYATLFAVAPSLADLPLPGLSGVRANNELSFLDFVTALLLLGAVGKSAQLGLHTWLPDAREGPTPVSALLHAATRVTAGIVLLCRSSPLLEYAPHTPALLTILGARTAFFAATTGLLQNDLKRVIAYSTCSQLGYRLFAVGLSAYPVSRFHLTTHAVFKALLFLGAGSVIHARGDEQDRRKRGGLVRILPLTYSARRVGSLALRGFPYLAGFYSKDLLLEVAYGSFTVHGRFAYTLGTRAAAVTAFYSRRLSALTFLGSPTNGSPVAGGVKGFRVLYEHAHEGGWPRRLPLIILSLLSLVLGYIRRDRRVGVGTDFWGTALFVHPTHEAILSAERLDFGPKTLPLIAATTGAVSSLILYTRGLSFLLALQSTKLGRGVYTFLNRKWRWDKVYAEGVAAPLLGLGYTATYQTRDRGLLELLGPQGIATEIYARSRAGATRSLGFVGPHLLVRLLAVGVSLAFLAIWAPILPSIDIGRIRVGLRTLWTLHG